MKKRKKEKKLVKKNKIKIVRCNKNNARYIQQVLEAGRSQRVALNFNFPH